MPQTQCRHSAQSIHHKDLSANHEVNLDNENRAQEAEAAKQQQLKEQKEGKGEWKDALASDSESIVRFLPFLLELSQSLRSPSATRGLIAPSSAGLASGEISLSCLPCRKITVSQGRKIIS
jgi:hypothetical protein